LIPKVVSDSLLVEEPGVVLARGWRNLAIVVWTGQATGPAAALIGQMLDRPEARGMRQSYIHVIHNKRPLPDAAARREFVQMMKNRARELACIGVVVLGSGFWASAMRNAVIGMRVFAPSSFDFRVFGSCEEVADWLPAAHERLTGVAIPENALTQWLSAARDAMPLFETRDKQGGGETGRF
jgi:hypothetical protein